MKKATVKQCPICKRYFFKSRKRKETCGDSECRRNYTNMRYRERYKKNGNKILDKNRQYYHNNKERAKEVSKIWYEKNRKKVLKRVQNYYMINRERLLKKEKERRENRKNKKGCELCQ